jgi:hypothetical protein
MLWNTFALHSRAVLPAVSHLNQKQMQNKEKIEERASKRCNVADSPDSNHYSSAKSKAMTPEAR